MGLQACASVSSRAQRFGLIGSLYVSQAIPLGFVFVALPAILVRRGLGEEQIGLLSALAAPWLVKFLWAPAVDRFGSRRGHYRSWLIPLQLLSVSAVAAMALFRLDAGLAPLLGCIAASLATGSDVPVLGRADPRLHHSKPAP